MLGVQIKGGASFFSETAGDGIVFRSEERHLEYWLGHSLPVVVALYDPGDQAILWQAVTPETAQSRGKGWKLVVPRAQRLDASSAPALQDLVEGDPYTSGLNALRADLSWMRLLRDGGRVWVEVEEWVDKSSGRGSITLIGRPAGGGERLERTRGVYLGLMPYDQVIPPVPLGRPRRRRGPLRRQGVRALGARGEHLRLRGGPHDHGRHRLRGVAQVAGAHRSPALRS
jgi:hypothetical protein